MRGCVAARTFAFDEPGYQAAVYRDVLLRGGVTRWGAGVVARKLSVPSIIPAAPKLPTAEAWGATGLAAIKEPRVICMTPMSRASFCAPSFLRSREVRGLAVTRTSAFWTSESLN